MSYRNFLDELRKGFPSSNYILASSDPFLHTEAASMIKKLVPEGEREFNFQTFDLLAPGDSSTPFEQIIDVLNTVPFFSDRKFVIIENFQKLLKKDLKKLEQYLLNPCASCVLILLNTGALKKDTRENLKGIKYIILDIKGNDILIWLKEKAKTKGFEISDSASDYLLGTIGTDLGMLSSELDKCMLIGKTSIKKEDIIEIIEGKKTYSAFALVDAITAKDTEKALKIYKILSSEEEPHSLLGALNWQFGQVQDKNNSPELKDYYCNIFTLLNKANVHINSSGSFYPMELLLVKLLRLSKKR